MYRKLWGIASGFCCRMDVFDRQLSKCLYGTISHFPGHSEGVGMSRKTLGEVTKLGSGALPPGTTGMAISRKSTPFPAFICKEDCEPRCKAIVAQKQRSL